MDGGKEVFIGTASKLRLVDVRTEKDVALPDAANRSAGPAAISMDGRRLAACAQAKPGTDGSEVQIWDILARTLISSSHQSPTPEYLAFAPHGSRLLIVIPEGYHKRWFHVIDVASAREMFAPLQTDYDYTADPSIGIQPASFSSDGKSIAIAASTWFSVYDAQNGNLMLTNHGVEGIRTDTWLLKGVAFTRDGSKLLAVRAGWTRLWNAKTGGPAGRELYGNVLGYSLSPDGRNLAACWEKGGDLKDEGAGLWDLRSGKEIARLGGADAQAVAFAPGGSMLAIGQKTRGGGDTSILRLKPILQQ